MEAALADGATLVHPDLGTNAERHLGVRLRRRPAPAADVDEAIAAAAADPDSIVVERRFRQQRLIPAFMEPRSTRGRPDRRADHHVDAPPRCRTSCGLMTGARPRASRSTSSGSSPRTSAAGSAASCRSRPRRCVTLAGRPEAGQAGEVHRDPLGVAAGRAPRPRPDPATDADGHARTARSPASTSTCWPTWAPTSAWSRRACRSWARSCSTPSTRSRRYRFTCTNVFTNKTLTDAYRGAGRPEATFGDRADDGRARRRARPRPDGAARAELDQARGVPVHHGRRADLRLGQLRGRHREGHGAVRLRRAAAPSRQQRRRERRPGPARASASRRSPRCAGSPRPGCSGSLAYGAGGWETASIRMLPTGKVEVVTGSSRARPGPRDGVVSQIVADQLGVPFEDVEVLHGDTQFSPKGLDTYGSRSLVVGGIAIVKAAREGGRARRKTIAAHLLEASEDDLEFADGTLHASSGTDQGMSIGRSRSPSFAAHNLPDGVEPIAGLRRRPSTRRTSPSRTAPTCAPIEVDTETGQVDAALLRLRGRHRRRGQPADRRGPGARRAGPGHRAGAVRGGRTTTTRAR